MVVITFLGTGGAFPTKRRTNLALLIEAGDFRMLAETGPAILQQLARANLRAAQIEHVFISHAHGDHILGFPMLALNRLPNPTPLHIYTAARNAETLRELWELAYRGFLPLRPRLQRWVRARWQEPAP